MSRVPRTTAWAGAAVLVLSTAASGGGSAGEEPKAEGLSTAADQSTCIADARRVAMPDGKVFPADWPFPTRSVVFNAEDRGRDGTIVTAVTATRFPSVLDFMNHQVAGAGFEVEKGETEEHDAEAEWRGNGFRGRWSIRESATCPGETVVQVLSTSG